MSKISRGIHANGGLLALCLLGSALFISGKAQAQQPGQSDKNAEIKKVLKERYDELKKVVDLLTIQFREGRVKFDTLAQAQRDALKASVDLYDTPKERIAAIRKYLEAVTQMNDMADAMFKAGQVTQIAWHQARAIVLKVGLNCCGRS